MVVVGLAFTLFTRVAAGRGDHDLAARIYGAAEHHFTMMIPPFMRDLFFDPAGEIVWEFVTRPW